MTDSIAGIVDRLAERIETVASIGRVLKWDPYDRSDISEWITSEMDGVLMTRAWWVSGPTMGPMPQAQGRNGWLTSMSPQHIPRLWTFTIHGVEGLSPAQDGDTRDPGESLQTLRDFAVQVSDALDSDGLDHGGTTFNSHASFWQTEPRIEAFGRAQIALAHVVIAKQVSTMAARV